MPDNSSKSAAPRWVPVWILALCLAPVLIALALYYNPEWIGGRIHHGRLIAPAIQVARGQWLGFDDFSKENIEEISGHWILLQWITPHGCSQTCQNSLNKTRQVRLMLGKDLSRIRRVAVVMAEVSEKNARSWWKEHPHLLRIRSTPDLEKLASSTLGAPIPEGVVMILDPLGNLMMWYPSGFDPYGLKKDLQRLLQVSRLG